MAYPPGLLPERSWRKMMAELDKHFGQNASLDAAATKAILDYLVENSAERSTQSAVGAFPWRRSRHRDPAADHRECLFRQGAS